MAQETTAPSNMAMVEAEVHPHSLPMLRKYTVRNIATITNTAPKVSNLPISFAGSLGIVLIPMIAPMIPIGTFTKNTQCHERNDVSRPPSTGPMTDANEDIDTMMARAFVRSFSGKNPNTMAASIAPNMAEPNPWKALQPINSQMPPERPHISELRAKTMKPVTKILP
ncbi:MAG: hypothetical protein A4E32_00159 [Methanomassiliicoccales archaeon PtaU1.Bin124]|nr:MAG: hypothetical protein A4E32_00159 [Methanomassiliicoccales archaeon PtaU1.Bin124]